MYAHFIFNPWVIATKNLHAALCRVLLLLQNCQIQDTRTHTHNPLLIMHTKCVCVRVCECVCALVLVRRGGRVFWGVFDKYFTRDNPRFADFFMIRLW